MLTNFESSVILKLLLEEKINCKKSDIKFKSRCFTGWGWYLYFDTNFDKIFISRTINIDYLNNTWFYFSFTLFCQDIDNFYLQVTANPIKDLNQAFSEDIFCSIKDISLTI